MGYYIDEILQQYGPILANKNMLIVKRLQLLGLDDKIIAQILYIIFTTCPSCWDHNTAQEPCYCMSDD